MKKVGVALLGLGVVGGGVYKILTEKSEYFKKTQGLEVSVESVLVRNADKAIQKGVPENKIVSTIEDVISNPAVDVVVEVIGGTEPAKSYVLKALMSGKTVVTANKELVAKHWRELEEMAKNMNAGLFFEASCVGGVPVIRTLQDGMQANEIKSIKGIINGTTNYILTKMSNEGYTYEQALKEAQRLGYAEADSTADIEGFDATYKLSILASIAFNSRVLVENVKREGISFVDKADIAYGQAMGYTLKLLGIGKNEAGGIDVRVHPTFIRKDDPLASVNDSFNAVLITGDSVGEIMLYGKGAGALPTASAVVSDIIFAAKHEDYYYAPFISGGEAVKAPKFVSDFVTKYYIRLSVADSAGVLSKITGIFAKNNISIKEVKQTSAEEGGAEIVIITHPSEESAMQKTLDKLRSVSEVFAIKGFIRIEE